ncbi:hypothetical protein [Novosphingobium pokkalii]|uniref:Uncharacterized protein n=1 Tax=Novosphingobium pokkalii TaxID=1770194 RepID=A0ABV7V1P2_9SPHN|nr:hypothetical protein [Novosphingobium pokkalii]GHC82147.1 hypothetical protein GCM10019060_00530 [Novosphingobium pokkalii]
MTIDWQDLFDGPWHAMAAVGGVLLAVALWALFAERRRTKRNDLDRVGCMPWTMIYVLCFFLACVLLGGAVRTALGS